MPEAENQAASAQGGAAEGSLLGDIMQATKMAPSDEGYDVA